MAYNPTIWVNDDGSGTVGTPVIAGYLNNIEQGVKNNDDKINVLNESITKIFLTKYIAKWNQSLNQALDYGTYNFANVTDGLPMGYTSGDNDLYLWVIGTDVTLSWQNFIMMDARSNRMFKRVKTSGSLSDWREI